MHFYLYFWNCKPSPQILCQHCVLRNLQTNQQQIITKPDKGNGTVILDQNLYNGNLFEFISDALKFEKLNTDPITKWEAVFQRNLCKLKQKGFFNEYDYNQLYPFGSTVAHIYGLPKMHKFSPSDPFPKLRPTVSSIGTCNNNLT